MTNYKSIAAAVLVTCSSLLAVKTQYWTTNTQELFAKGTTHDLVINNRGAVKLSRATKSLLPADQHFDTIMGMAVAGDGSIFFGSFPDNKVMKLKDGKLETLAEFEDKTITTIHVTSDNKILVATAGDQGEVLQITAGQKPKTIFKQDGVQYIWSILETAGKLLVATGPEAKIYEIKPDGSSSEVVKLDGENVLSLVADKEGTLYAGTDQNGLVYRIDLKTGKSFLLYDAAEAEISALGIDKDGNLIAATGEEREASPEPQVIPTGKPEAAETHPAIPSKQPITPKQDDVAPTPDPIPKENPAQPEAAATTQEAAAEPTVAIPTPTLTNPATTETQGNAVYRISKSGVCTELYRGPVTIHAIAVQDGRIILATGDEGRVIEINPAEEETATIVDTDSAQVNLLATAKDGSLLLGCSNGGDIRTMTSGYASSGTYESEIHDATSAATFGNMQLRGQLPDGTSMTASVRSGNAADPEKGGWSDWSAPEPAKEYLPIKTPSARYFQYKLTFTTTNPKLTASLDEVVQAYERPNVAPRIDTISVSKDSPVPGASSHTVTWNSTDPNEDTLEFSVYARVVGKSAWVELAKDLTAVTYTWNTKETVDGRYEIKLVASDEKDNQPGEGLTASRISSPISVDNTPPVIGDINVTPDGANTKVTLRAVDRAGSIEKLEYALDSATHWQKRLPDDTIADSPEERFTIVLTGLAKGPHTLSVRATDQQGNVSYENINVTGQ